VLPPLLTKNTQNFQRIKDYCLDNLMKWENYGIYLSFLLDWVLENNILSCKTSKGFLNVKWNPKTKVFEEKVHLQTLPYMQMLKVFKMEHNGGKCWFHTFVYREIIKNENAMGKVNQKSNLISDHNTKN